MHRGPGALTHRGHEYNEAPVRSHTGARSSMRPHCAHAQGPEAPSAVGNALYDASGRRTRCRGLTRRERTTRRTVSYKASGPDASGMYDASYSVVQGVVQHRHRTTQYDTVRHSTTQYDTVRHSTTQYDTVRHSTTRYDTVRHSTTQYDTVRHSTTQYDTVRHTQTYTYVDI